MSLRRMYRSGCLLSAVLLHTMVFAQNDNDSLLPRNSLRLEIAGKALGGVGFTFEHTWRNEGQTQHPRAFNSLEVNASWTLIEYSIVSVGINRNWYLGTKRKWTINCGLAAAALVCFNPTPKWMRDYYDSIQFYGGWYVNPVEPWLLGNVSCRYTFNRMFVQVSITPFLYYDRAYNRGFLCAPWGGVSLGINLKTKDERKLKQRPSMETDKENDTNSE